MNGKAHEHVYIEVKGSDAADHTKSEPVQQNGASVIGQPQQPKATYFIVRCALVFVFYVIYGIALEFIYKLPNIEEFSWFITLMQFCLYTLFAFIQMVYQEVEVGTRISMKLYSLMALITVGTMGFSNASMGYLNFPTQVIFKSCKLIPVMIGSIIILKKKYTFSHVVACLLMCVGLIWFTLADSKVQPSFNLTGVALVSVSLCCDAVIGNVQEGMFNSQKEPESRFVFYSYGIGSGILLALTIVQGTLLPAISFTRINPSLVPGLLLLSVSGFLGVQVVLQLVASHGAVVAITVTTARKAASIALSFFMFTKPFTLQYVFGGSLVALGIYLNVLVKQKNNKLVQTLDLGYLHARSFFASHYRSTLWSYRKTSSQGGEFNV